jgi:hypothetical protein
MFAQQANNSRLSEWSGFLGRAPVERALLHIACARMNHLFVCRPAAFASACFSFFRFGFFALSHCNAEGCKAGAQKKMGETPIFFYCQGGRTRDANKSRTPSDPEILAFF